MKPALKKQLVALAALAIAGGGLAVIAYGSLGENLVYYWSPGEMVTQGERAYDATVRLGGVVRPGSVEWNAEHTELAFLVSDDHKLDSPVVRVVSREVPPQMFREGIGVVVEGSYHRDGVFRSNRLMVNHSNEYRAPAEGEEPPGWQETMTEPATTARTQ